MNRRVLSVLAVVLVALLGYVWLERRSDRASRAGTPQLNEPVVAVPTSELLDLEIVRQGGLTASFRRGDQGWELLEGPDGLAMELLPDVLYTWTMLHLMGRTPGATDLAPYGLEPPLVALRSRSRGGDVVSLELGDRSNLVGYVGYYARVDGGDEISLVDITAENLVSQVDQLLGLVEVMPE